MIKKICYQLSFEEIAEKFGIQSKLSEIRVDGAFAEFVFMPEQTEKVVETRYEITPTGKIDTTKIYEYEPVPASNVIGITSNTFKNNPNEPTNIPATPADLVEDSELNTFKIKSKTKPMVDDKLLNEVKEIKKGRKQL